MIIHRQPLFASAPISINSDNFSYVGTQAGQVINDPSNSHDQITTWQGGDSHATVNLGTGTANTVTLHTFDTVNASAGSATFTEFNGHDNTFVLGDGDFTATLGSNDAYKAGNGTNTIDFYPGATNTSITLGNGTNTVSAGGTQGNFTLKVGTGSNTLDFYSMTGGNLDVTQAANGAPMILNLNRSTLNSVNVVVSNPADLILTDSSTINSLHVTVNVDGYKPPYAGTVTYGTTNQAIASGFNTAQALPYFISNLLFDPVNRWTTGLGTQQTPVGLSFSFMQTSPSSADAKDLKGFAALGPDLPDGYSPHALLTMYSQGKVNLSAGEISALTALANWSDVVNVNFVSSHDTESVYVRVGSNDQGSASGGYAYSPLVPIYPYYPSQSYLKSGTVYLNNNGTTNSDYLSGGYAGLVFAHEFGHVLGQGGESGNSDSHDVLPFGEDSTSNTVESYNTQNYPYPNSPKPFDVATSQYLYGPNANYHPNPSHIWSFNAQGGTGNLIADGGGQVNTISAQNTSASGLIDLRQGHWSYLGSQSSDVLAPNQLFIDYGTVVTNVVAGQGATTIVCNDNSDTITCGNGGDLVVVAGGAAHITAGSGGDTILFADARANYSVNSSAGQAIVTETNAPANRSTLQGIATIGSVLNVAEALKFSDQTMYLAGAEQASVAMLYQGALGRIPDTVGLASWIAIDNRLPAATLGLGVYHLSDTSGNYAGNLSIAGGFTNSAEFIQKYGALSNAQFVTNLYANILDRAPDPGGFNSWLNQLSSGSSREHVLIGFAESAEALHNAEVGYTGQSGYHAPWLIVV